MIVYGFDDLSIGVMQDDGGALRTTDIPRPQGLKSGSWYLHAQRVCALLNSLSDTEAHERLNTHRAQHIGLSKSVSKHTLRIQRLEKQVADLIKINRRLVNTYGSLPDI